MTLFAAIMEVHHCLNCGSEFTSKFCPQCGQRDVENSDRSIIRLTIDLLNNVFFFDNRFWISIRYLLTRPGKMTVEFLEGKRRKFISPITLFLFVNVLYFFLSPLTDYSLPLADQMKYQAHSEMATRMVEDKLKKHELSNEAYQESLRTYATKYQSASDNISKSLMILNVPIVALFVYLLSLRKRPYYFDALIFSLHYFTLFLLSISVGDILKEIIQALGDPGANFLGIWLLIFVLIIPLTYLSISLSKYLGHKWFVAIALGIFVFIGGGLAQFLYRAIIFFLAFWST